MAINDYHFIERWQLRATADELTEIFQDIRSLKQWWSDSFCEVDVLQQGTQGPVGQAGRLHVKGWLPYTLRFRFTITEFTGLRLVAEVQGDFEGRYLITLQETSGQATVTFDTKLRVTKPLLRYLSWVLKPIFKANHFWSMARGREGLVQELARRRAARYAPDRGPVPGRTASFARTKERRETQAFARKAA